MTQKVPGAIPSRRAQAETAVSDDRREPWHEFESLLPSGAGRVVVIIAHPAVRGRLSAWLRPFADDDVHIISKSPAPEWDLDQRYVTFHTGETPHELSWQVRRIGAVDVLVNLLPIRVAEQHTIWQRLFCYLKPGGVYLVDQGASDSGAFGTELTAWVRYVDSGAEPTTSSGRPSRQRELSDSTAAFASSRDLVLIKKQQKHYVKLKDAHASRLLKSRNENVTVTELERLSAGHVDSRAVVTSHESAVPVAGLEQRLDHPKHVLRHYQGQVAFAGSTLMFTDYSILPDSFRHHLLPDLNNPLLKNVSVSFARVPAELMPKETLPGNYYLLDSTFSGHFGHLTTEVLAKLWGWDLAKRTIPDLKALFSIRNPYQRDPALERRFFTAYGIAEEDIVWVDRPVILESVVAATPMWHNSEPHYVHPGMVEVWDRLGRHLIDETVPDRPRIFVSRASVTERRTCRNAREVEDFFAARGFTVIYPEQLDLREQAGIFAKASVIAGFGGSAMFNVMHARNMTTLILLSHEAYTARNEHLFTALLGGNVHYFWSAPDISHPEGQWSKAAFYSDWEFDFARNGDALERVIDEL